MGTCVRPHGGGVLLHVLAAGAGGPVDFHLHVLFGDVDLHLVHFGQHRDGGGGGVDAARGFGDRHPLDAVHAGFELQPRKGALALHLEDHFLKSADAGIALRKQLGLPVVFFGVAAVHPEEVGGEQPGFVAAGSGADFDDHIALVARIPRQEHGFQFLLERLELRGEHGRFAFGERLEFGIGFGEHRPGLVQGVPHFFILAVFAHDRLDLGTLARQFADARVLFGVREPSEPAILRTGLRGPPIYRTCILVLSEDSRCSSRAKQELYPEPFRGRFRARRCGGDRRGDKV